MFQWWIGETIMHPGKDTPRNNFQERETSVRLRRYDRYSIRIFRCHRYGYEITRTGTTPAVTFGKLIKTPSNHQQKIFRARSPNFPVFPVFSEIIPSVLRTSHFLPNLRTKFISPCCGFQLYKCYKNDHKGRCDAIEYKRHPNS